MKELNVKKPRNRRERIDFICAKKGNAFKDIFVYMNNQEVKNFFDSIYTSIKDKPDKQSEDAICCLRCGCDVEHHLECGCGIDKCVFTEEEWRYDIENNSELTEADHEFIKNNFKS